MNSQYAWVQSFLAGTTDGYKRVLPAYVRCVRDFNVGRAFPADKTIEMKKTQETDDKDEMK